MDLIGYSVLLLGGLIFIILVPCLLQLSISVYITKIENVVNVFSSYSKFKKDFLVLKKELYQFYIQTLIVFVLITSLYIWAALFIKPEEKEFLSYIIVISFIYFICLLEILIFPYFLNKKIKKVKFLTKEEALEEFEKLRLEITKNLNYKSFELKDISKIREVDKHFQRVQKILKRKISNLKNKEDNYKKIKIFFWYLRANGFLFSTYIKNSLNLQIIVDQNLYESSKIPEILIEFFFLILNNEELRLSEMKTISS
ncbi:hypothetical protein [Spiroplasma endosymbiont of Atherix ibis]|uniref:hypothetical protein n=1 Tax=Spiroplasma endosymbiont of Atherix ibis TaxID=3066291 RepID=UPI0030CF617C